MSFLVNNTTGQLVSTDLIPLLNTFDCGNPDLNDFFQNDCLNYEEQLLGKTYCITLDEDPEKIVALYTVANDSLKVDLLPNPQRNRINRPINHHKRMSSYPAVLIGRLGLNKDFIGKVSDGKSIGDELMDIIKRWFTHPENKTGCRFLLVDAYNTEGVIAYYERNQFQKVFPNEEEEQEHYNREELRTRLLYFDLIKLKK